MPFKLCSVAASSKKLELTADQARAYSGVLDQMMKARRHTQKPPITIAVSGYAGTGKTTLTQKIVKTAENYYPCPQKAVTVVAPTHKAAAVLREKLVAADCAVSEVITVHRLLNMQASRCSKTGERKFIQKEAPQIEMGLQLLIFDELSMISFEMMELIEKFATSGKNRRNFPQLVVLGIGDPDQLMPVNADPNEFFEGADYRYDLKKVVRHDGGILDLATSIRTNRQRPEIKPTRMGDSLIEVCDAGEWREKWFSSLIQTQSDYKAAVKALAYRNVTVAKHNKAARDFLFGADALPFQQSESFVVKDVVQDPDSKRSLAGAGTEFVVLSNVHRPTDIDGTVVPVYEVRGYLPDIKGSNGIALTVEFETIDPAFNKEFEGLIKARQEEAKAFQKDFNEELTRDDVLRRELWRNFYELDERFTLLEPGFCLTVHKSQGSTYREVFIDQKDIDKASKADDRWRLSYVAATRASERAVFLIN